MKVCVVPSCASRSGKYKNISFHILPLDASLCERWIQVLERHGASVHRNDGSKVCSLHFTSRDFSISTARKRLLPWAVPSIFEGNTFSVEPDTQPDEYLVEVCKSELQDEEICLDSKTKVCSLDFISTDYSMSSPPSAMPSIINANTSSVKPGTQPNEYLVKVCKSELQDEEICLDNKMKVCSLDFTSTDYSTSTAPSAMPSIFNANTSSVEPDTLQDQNLDEVYNQEIYVDICHNSKTSEEITVQKLRTNNYKKARTIKVLQNSKSRLQKRVTSLKSEIRNLKERLKEKSMLEKDLDILVRKSENGCQKSSFLIEQIKLCVREKKLYKTSNQAKQL